jgi:hypothetical protein
MNALILGGDRHGEWVDVLDGAQVWVDIRNATNHRIRKLTWMITDPKGEVAESYELFCAVHEGLLGPNEPQIAAELLRMLTMNEFVRAHGAKQEIPKEPAGASLVVPGQPT